MLKAREHKNLGGATGRAKYVFLASLVFASAVGVISYYKEGGLNDLMNMDKKLERHRWALKRMEAENSLLRRRIKSIRDDSYLIEKFARERLHLVKENEIVFRFYDEPVKFK